MRKVRLKTNSKHWGYITAEGTLDVVDMGVTYTVVRVMWANDQEFDVLPPSLQYESDLEEIGQGESS